jgi:hypothetical protein
MESPTIGGHKAIRILALQPAFEFVSTVPECANGAKGHRDSKIFCPGNWIMEFEWMERNTYIDECCHRQTIENILE